MTNTNRRTDQFTRREVGYGHPSGQFGAGRAPREEATDPEYWRDRADRFNRSASQRQGDWNERLWRSASGQRGGESDDRGEHRFDGQAQWEEDSWRGEDFGYGDGQRSSDYPRREEASRFGRDQFAPDWRESQFGKGPKGYKRSDERITEEINQCLMDDHRIDASDIEVKVQGGEVSLTGTVSDRRCRRNVEDLVESISGVSDVSNQLKTNPATKSSSSSKSGGSGGA